MNQVKNQLSQSSPVTQSSYSKGFVIGLVFIMIFAAVLTAWRFFVKHDYYITKNPTVIER